MLGDARYLGQVELWVSVVQGKVCRNIEKQFDPPPLPTNPGQGAVAQVKMTELAALPILALWLLSPYFLICGCSPHTFSFVAPDTGCFF